MEPEYSLPFSQQPITYLYPEPREYCPGPASRSRSVLLLSHNICLSIARGLILSGFNTIMNNKFQNIINNLTLHIEVIWLNITPSLGHYGILQGNIYLYSPNIIEKKY